MVEMLLKKWFSMKLSPRRIDRALSRIEAESTGKKASGSETMTVRVSCIQRQIRPAASVGDYIARLDAFVRQAAKEESRLAVFPEYNFFDLFGLIPGFALIDGYLSGKAKSKVRAADRQQAENAEADESGYSFFYKIFSATSAPIEAALLRIMSALAARYGIYVYSGSYISKRDAALYNSGTLFGPDGSPVLTQNKLHLTEFEINIGLKGDDFLHVFPLFGTKAAMPICMDATYFETFHAARSAGADIVMLPIANMEEYSLWKSLRGIWPRVQEAYVYGLKASLNGWIAGMHFTGKAGIFAPIPLTPDGRGVLSISSRDEGDEVVSADLDFKKLHEAREAAEYYGDTNAVFEKDYIINAYQGGVKHEKDIGR